MSTSNSTDELNEMEAKEQFILDQMKQENEEEAMLQRIEGLKTRMEEQKKREEDISKECSSDEVFEKEEPDEKRLKRHEPEEACSIMRTSGLLVPDIATVETALASISEEAETDPDSPCPETPASPFIYNTSRFIFNGPPFSRPKTYKKPRQCKTSFCRHSNPPSFFRTALEYECHQCLCHGVQAPKNTPYTCAVGFCKDSEPKPTFESKGYLAFHVSMCHGVYIQPTEEKL